MTNETFQANLANTIKMGMLIVAVLGAPCIVVAASSSKSAPQAPPVTISDYSSAAARCMAWEENIGQELRQNFSNNAPHRRFAFNRVLGTTFHIDHDGHCRGYGTVPLYSANLENQRFSSVAQDDYLLFYVETDAKGSVHFMAGRMSVLVDEAYLNRM